MKQTISKFSILAIALVVCGLMMPAEQRTSEFMLSLLQKAATEKTPGETVEEANYLELSGQRGFYVLSTKSNNEFSSGWVSYRLLGGKAQAIYVSVEGRQSEISKAKKIINSLKLSAE